MSFLLIDATRVYHVFLRHSRFASRQPKSSREFEILHDLMKNILFVAYSSFNVTSRNLLFRGSSSRPNASSVFGHFIKEMARSAKFLDIFHVISFRKH